MLQYYKQIKESISNNLVTILILLGVWYNLNGKMERILINDSANTAKIQELQKVQDKLKDKQELMSICITKMQANCENNIGVAKKEDEEEIK